MWASRERDGGIGNTEIFIELVSHVINDVM